MIPFEVVTIFENENWLVVDKPAGWLTVPGRNAGTEPVLGLELQKNRGFRVWPVHRLDREVSGLVCFAKNASAHKTANGWFENKQVLKTYEAWTAVSSDLAIPYQKEQEWELKLVKGKRRAFEADHGQSAITRAVKVDTLVVPGKANSKLDQWYLNPITGRSHQLRVTMAIKAKPILGDVLYGGATDETLLPAGSIALRAIQLDFKNVPASELLGLPSLIQTKGLREWLKI